ncbi:hypothetical protein WISP_134780 [Willisornis vidua]|uniref:Uncharacterized protein n=1 Tax=Willisornis vidua TaxID=1566151 RepID=A0ABQ9CTM3_9PASS|nr:hypothetical protein WISP_134780 [Willisornis vidua]
MADCAPAGQPGMVALPSAGCGQGSASGMSGQKPKKKAFYLVRMKPLKEPSSSSTTTTTNVSFVIQYHIGKEIKHICSNCSRGEEARDGECRDAVGVAARQGSACACMGVRDPCALPAEPGMLLHSSQGKRRGSAEGMRWAPIQAVDQGDAKRHRSPRLPPKLCANS